MEKNGSPELYYKVFSDSDSVTSVVIPVNEEYLLIKTGIKPNKKLGIEEETQVFKDAINTSTYTKKVKDNLHKMYNNLKETTIGNSDVIKLLGCSETTATSYIKKLNEELNLLAPVAGAGKGKYRFK